MYIRISSFYEYHDLAYKIFRIGSFSYKTVFSYRGNLVISVWVVQTWVVINSPCYMTLGLKTRANCHVPRVEADPVSSDIGTSS